MFRQFSLTLLLAVTLLTGCGDSYVRANISASGDVNPNRSGKPSPIVVQIYHLQASEEFENQDFFQLIDDGGSSLGGDLLLIEEVELQPGTELDYEAPLNEKTKYIGVVASFRDIQRAKWRDIRPLKDLGGLLSGSFTIKLDKLSVSIGD